MVCLERVVLGRRGILVDGTRHIELKTNGVVVKAAGIRVFTSLWLLVPLEEVMQTFAATFEGNKTKAVGEDLVLNDGGVVFDVDILDSECRNLGEHDTTESVCERGIDSNERERREELVVLVEVYRKGVAKAINGESKILARVVPGVVGRGNV